MAPSKPWRNVLLEQLVTRDGVRIESLLREEVGESRADALAVLAPRGFFLLLLMKRLRVDDCFVVDLLSALRGRSLIEVLAIQLGLEPGDRPGDMVEDYLEERENPPRFVLVGLDEARASVGKDDLSLLRGFHDRRLARFTYVGTEAPSALGQRIEESKFTDIFQRFHYVKVLKEPVVDAAVRANGEQLNDPDLELVVEQSGGVPELAEFCLQRLFKELNKEGVLTNHAAFKEGVRRVALKKAELTALFTSWWNLIPEQRTQAALRRLAQGEQVELSGSELDWVERRLLLVRRRSEGDFAFRSDLFRAWLRDEVEEGMRQQFDPRQLIDRLKNEIPEIYYEPQGAHRHLELAWRYYVDGDANPMWAECSMHIRHALERTIDFACARLKDHTGKGAPSGWMNRNKHLVEALGYDESVSDLMNSLESPIQKGLHAAGSQDRAVVRLRLLGFAAIAELLLDGLARIKR